jgi:hypothetical protein
MENLFCLRNVASSDPLVNHSVVIAEVDRLSSLADARSSDLSVNG